MYVQYVYYFLLLLTFLNLYIYNKCERVNSFSKNHHYTLSVQFAFRTGRLQTCKIIEKREIPII